MNIKGLLVEKANISVAVTLADLKEFFSEVAAEIAASKPQVEDEKYLSADEVAETLGVTKPTLWRWAKTGYLPSCHIGRKPVWKLSDVDKLRGRQ